MQKIQIDADIIKKFITLCIIFNIFFVKNAQSVINLKFIQEGCLNTIKIPVLVSFYNLKKIKNVFHIRE